MQSVFLPTAADWGGSYLRDTKNPYKDANAHLHKEHWEQEISAEDA
jgi:hypothetical protein